MTATKFDPTREKALLLDPVGGFEWALNRNMDDSRSCGGLGSSASFYLGLAVQCLLVEFDEPAERLLKQVANWVQVAIETDERPQRYFPGATEAQRFQTLALCNWLLSNEHDAATLQHFIEQEDCYLNAQTRKDKIGVSLTLVSYVNAGALRERWKFSAAHEGFRRRPS